MLAYRDRNATAIFYIFALTPTPNPATTGPSLGQINTEFLKVIRGQQDVNTALRVAEEGVDKAIAEFLASN